MSREAPTMDELYGVGAEEADAQAQHEADMTDEELERAQRLNAELDEALVRLSNLEGALRYDMTTEDRARLVAAVKAQHACVVAIRAELYA